MGFTGVHYAGRGDRIGEEAPGDVRVWNGRKTAGMKRERLITEV